MNRLRRLWQSRTLRLAVAVASLLALALGINSRHFTARLRDDQAVKSSETVLQATLDVLQVAYDTGGIDAVRRILAQRFSDRSGTILFLLRAPAGEVLVSNVTDLCPIKADRINTQVRSLLPPVGQATSPRLAYDDSTPWAPGYAVVYQSRQFADGHEVVVGLNTSYVSSLLEVLDDTSDLVKWATLIVGACGFLAVAYLINRLNQIADTAREIIETGDLARRIPLRSRRDDFGQLASLLNAMLARIEGQMGSVRQVADNLAHDLRTPLTRLRNKIEALRGQLGTNRLEVDELVAEAENLLGVFNALLHIANVEQGARCPALVRLEVAPLLSDLVEAYEPLATARGLAIAVEAMPAGVLGEKHLLFQALANLVDNAIKFTPAGGRILVAGRQTADGVLLVVADTGAGIPQEAKEKVFERFYRLDASRHQPGNGLGLSLVRAVVHLHHGRIQLVDNRPGLRVELLLPVSGGA
ncbi:MAG: HAMP domain-containing protein [Opitutaceae bacterium]|nr:HAMP domain-containing protein [Opitutaceae bacterium]